jgi:hypothetical protein
VQTTKIGSVAEPFCEAENGLLYCNMRLAATAQGHSRRSDGQQGFADVRYAFNGDRICASQRTDAKCHKATYAVQQVLVAFGFSYRRRRSAGAL